MLISNHGEVFGGSNKSVWNDMEIATWMGLSFLSVIANEQQNYIPDVTQALAVVKMDFSSRSQYGRDHGMRLRACPSRCTEGLDSEVFGIRDSHCPGL